MPCAKVLEYVGVSRSDRKSSWRICFQIDDGYCLSCPGYRNILAGDYIACSASTDHVTYSTQDGAFAFSGAARSWRVGEDSVAHP